MAYVCDANSTKTGSPSTTVKIPWAYIDSSTKQVIDPTSFKAKLYDKNEIQRDPANTALTVSAWSTPIKDTDGSATGHAGWYYLEVVFDSAAVVGEWHIQTEFVHEGRTKTMNICFNVVEAGGEVSTDLTDVYTIPSDVIRFMSRNGVTIDSTTTFKTTDLEKYITQAESLIDDFIGRTYKSSKTIQAPDGTGVFCNLHGSKHGLYTPDYLASFRVPIGPIRSITKIEIFAGNTYKDITADVNNSNRPNGVWFDGNDVFLGRQIPMPYNPRNAIRIKYVAGLGTGGYVPIPEAIREAAEMMAAAKFLQSSHWMNQAMPQSDPTYFQFLARQWYEQAFARLEMKRGINWA